MKQGSHVKISMKISPRAAIARLQIPHLELPETKQGLTAVVVWSCGEHLCDRFYPSPACDGTCHGPSAGLECHS